MDVKTRPLPSPGLHGESGLARVFDAHQALESYSASRRRLLLLDLEGTLCSDDPYNFRRTRAVKSEELDGDLDNSVQASLEQLSADPKNTIYCLSGRSTEGLHRLTRRLPRLGFVCVRTSFSRNTISTNVRF